MKYLIALSVLTVSLAACSPSNPWVANNPPPPPKQKVSTTGDSTSTERLFQFFDSERTEVQKTFNENLISVFFQVMNGNNSVNGLGAKDFTVQENGKNVSPFDLSTDVKKTAQTVDIVFVLDVTGTMVPLIESAKAGIEAFIKTSRDRGYHTRMCFVTFGDYVVQHCDRFYENDPTNPKSSASQMKEFISRFSQLRAGKGPCKFFGGPSDIGCDPGWPDLDENPMGAIVDAAKAPWGSDSERFVILVTDWGFLYAPGNLGDPKIVRDPRTFIPSMKETDDAITKAQMKVFAVTRTQHDHDGKHYVWDGYNTPLDGQPSIVQASGGQYFDFDKFLNKQITLNDVLEKVLMTVTTTYKITYSVDKAGLNPTLKVEDRNIQISTADPKNVVTKSSVLSTMPQGREDYKDTWQVSSDAIQSGSLRVFLNGHELRTSEFQEKAGSVKIVHRPNPGDQLRFVFKYNDMSKNLRLEPIHLFSANPKATKVYFNGVEARSDEYTLAPDLDGNTNLSIIADKALTSEDRYGVRARNGLTVKVVSGP